jgi:hypothetical protein
VINGGQSMGNQRDGRERLARCCCGNLKVTARGEPVDVYLCSCTDCQRGTGSAFSYAAIFPVSAVSIAGERREYRQQGDSGRCVDSFFCPTCGTAVLFRAEGLPGTLGVPVSRFADPSFARPSKLLGLATASLARASCKHRCNRYSTRLSGHQNFAVTLASASASASSPRGTRARVMAGMIASTRSTTSR